VSRWLFGGRGRKRAPGAFASNHSEIVYAQQKARATFVWEIATLQCGAPVALLLAGLVLDDVMWRHPMRMRMAVLVIVGVFAAGLLVAYMVGRALWAIGVRPRR
jgi:hypothetical protein